MSNKTFHILNGDALLDKFPADILTGEIIIARECLIDGPVTGETFEDFCSTRANFIHETYEEETDAYFNDVASEFARIKAIPAGSEVNFWFEDDLFCQINFWFCISLLEPVLDSIKAYIVKPNVNVQEPDWRGFGMMDHHLLAGAYQNKQQLSLSDLNLFNNLWTAYQKNDRAALATLSAVKSDQFPFLEMVVQAQLDRANGRPQHVLKDIMKEKQTADFAIIFREFSKREGIYGFGDWQVQKLLEEINS